MGKEEFSPIPLDQMDDKQDLQEVNELKYGLEKDVVNSFWLQQFL